MNKTLPATAGTVGILNVGAGDTKLSFDPSNPAERIRAARIVKDMIRRGYSLLVEVGKEADGRPKYTRALDFKEDTCEYIIADFDPVTAAEEDLKEQQNDGHRQAEQQQPQSQAAASVGTPPTQKRIYTKRTVDAGSTSTVAVAPIAGG